MVARHADAVLYNGRIVTFADKRRYARALAVESGSIIAVGSDVEIRRSAPRGCEKYDLGGKLVLPGFIDSHTHFVQMGVDMQNVDLSAARDIDEALSLMKAAAEKTPENEWVIGANWQESGWKTRRFITREDLDRSCPKNPAVAHRVCGHLSSVNSRAISVLGIDSSMAGVESTPAGNLTGVLTESAVDLVRAATAPTEEKIRRGLALATKRAHSLGVTSVHDNGHVSHLKVYQDAERNRRLRVRVYFNAPSACLRSLLDLGMSSGLGSEWFRMGGLKIFCDGALGARSAALSEPFADDPSNRGMLVHERAVLEEMIAKANENGIQVAVHAIGDRGIEVALTAIERALESCPRRNHRHRIEHLELPTRTHLKRMARARIIASMQPNFIGEWGNINGMYYERLGRDRALRNNPFREVLDAGVRMVFGSDCMPFSPLYGIESAVNAQHVAQRISVDEALAAYTREGAFASFEDSAKGTIEEGRVADLVVLSADVLNEPAKLPSTRVVQTIVGGEVVFHRPRQS